MSFDGSALLTAALCSCVVFPFFGGLVKSMCRTVLVSLVWVTLAGGEESVCSVTVTRVSVSCVGCICN